MIIHELAVYLRNIYGGEAEVFVNNSEDIIYSKEGTTQSGPESMAFYAVSIMSLLDETPSVYSQDGHLKKVAFADDAAGGGSIKGMSLTWEDIKIDSQKAQSRGLLSSLNLRKLQNQF